MRSRHINFALAIVASVALHVLLWPAAKRLVLPDLGIDRPHETSGEITLLMNDDSPAPPKPVPPKPNPPAIDPQDDMGERNGKGTGANPAKGKERLRAPAGDQDQAFLSRDPVGQGKIGDPPTFDTGPRGQDGSGGQIGGLPTPPSPAHSPSQVDRLADQQPPNPAKPTADPQANRPPRQSLVHVPEPEAPTVTPPRDVAPPPAKTASIGAAPADATHPPTDEVKPHGPLAQVASVSEGDIALPPEQGPTTAPTKASSTAPPTKPDAPVERMAVALAPQLQIPAAAVAAPPPPEVQVKLPKPRVQEKAAPKPVPPPVPAAPALVTSGDARAPGRDRASADPAQESESESDAFAKKLISAVIHDGSLDVRQGRKVKTTRPHFLLGAFAAEYATMNPVLVLKISIDETGKVSNVEIIKSTGSVEIDQPCRVAVYDWWIEPAHDKHGRAVPDVIPFEIKFR